MASANDYTEAEIQQFRMKTAFEMGSANAIYQVAKALQPQNPEMAKQAADTLQPMHIQMLQDLRAA